MTPPTLRIPAGKDALVAIGDREVKLTNLDKPFWPALGIAKRDLLQYYADVSPVLLPHLADRAMVMKRYPDGADGEPFFMKRAPSPRPAWIETCAITHGSGSVIDFPMIQDLASLLWVVNLGCIDLNPWYARCDDVDRPDYLHFDLDPVPEATYAAVVETAQLVRAGLQGLGMAPIVKTTGSRGLHVYVAIVRGPTQKQVWSFAKRFAFDLAALATRRRHRRVPDRQAARRPRPRRLQPERLGPHPRLGLLAAAAAARHRVGADHLGRARRRRAHRGLRRLQHAGADRRGRRPVGAAARGVAAASISRRCSADPLIAISRRRSASRPSSSFSRASSIVELDRLDQMLVEAGVEGTPAIRAAAVAGQRDQDDPPRARIGAQRAGELVAVHRRQADVEDRRRRRETVEEAQRRVAVGRGLAPRGPRGAGRSASDCAASSLSSTTSMRVGRGPSAPLPRPAAPAPAAAASAIGKVTVKRAPRPVPALSTAIVPPWSSTRFLAIARPRPRPPLARCSACSPWTKRSKMRGAQLRRDADALVVDAQRRRLSPCGASSMAMRWSDAENLAALVIRLQITWVRRTAIAADPDRGRRPPSPRAAGAGPAAPAR